MAKSVVEHELGIGTVDIRSQELTQLFLDDPVAPEGTRRATVGGLEDQRFGNLVGGAAPPPASGFFAGRERGGRSGVISPRRSPWASLAPTQQPSFTYAPGALPDSLEDWALSSADLREEGPSTAQ
jgi:hypothetical protein